MNWFEKLVIWPKSRLVDNLWMEIAWLVPRGLAYWCTIRLGCHASQGKWSNESPAGMPMDTVLKRWHEHGLG